MPAAPLSIRFRDDLVASRLREQSVRSSRPLSALAEELIDEGLRVRQHPGIGFRDGPAGRRAVVVGGPDVTEVIGALIGGDVAVPEREPRTADLLGLTAQQVQVVLAYYADFTDEIDTELASNAEQAERAEQLWLRQQDLLAR